MALKSPFHGFTVILVLMSLNFSKICSYVDQVAPLSNENYIEIQIIDGYYGASVDMTIRKGQVIVDNVDLDLRGVYTGKFSVGDYIQVSAYSWYDVDIRPITADAILHDPSRDRGHSIIYWKVGIDGFSRSYDKKLWTLDGMWK